MSSERKIVGIDPVIIKANDMGYKLFKTKVREDHSYYTVVYQDKEVMLSVDFLGVFEFLEEKVNG